MLRTRLTLGPIMLAALAAICWLDDLLSAAVIPGWPAWLSTPQGRPLPGLVLYLVALAVMPIAAWELKQFLRSAGVAASRTVMTGAAFLGMSICYFDLGRASAAVIATSATAVLVAALAHHSRHRTTQGSLAAAGAALIAFVYLGLMFGFMLAIRREHSAWVLLAVMVITKACDIGAFFTGRTLGRHKLIPWLSPGKTWEGLFGGLVTSGACGYAAAVLAARTSEAANGGFSVLTNSPWLGFALGALLGVTAQCGDLLASLLKRDAGVKDSSTVVPGFGGVLDVVDSVLLTAPVAYWALVLVA